MLFQNIPISKKMSMLLILLIVCTSCSSYKYQCKKIVKSLKVQNKLIIKIKKQRESKEVIEQINMNSSLKRSEYYLKELFKSIQLSNEAVIRHLEIDRSHKGGRDDK